MGSLATSSLLRSALRGFGIKLQQYYLIFGNIPNTVVLISSTGIRRKCRQHSDAPTKGVQLVTFSDVMWCRFISYWGWVQNESAWTVKLTQISAEAFDFHYQNKSTRPHDWLSDSFSALSAYAHSHTALRDGCCYVYFILCFIFMFMCCGGCYISFCRYWNYSCRR